METDDKMFSGTYRLVAHPMSIISTVGKQLLGNGDRWCNVRWTPTGFLPRIMMMMMMMKYWHEV